tara:strand:+ start:1296 stop:3134 length:1839 start_codon:yes stop_codon:yes gene_type:complete
MSQKRKIRNTVIALFALLAYPIVANTLIVTGAAHVLANLKPEKLAMSWQSAWTILPGRFTVNGLEFKSTTPRNQFGLNVDSGKVSLSLFGLLARTVEITEVQAVGVEMRYSKVSPRVGARGETDYNSADAKPPWTIKLGEVFATEVRKVTVQNLTGVDDMEFIGSGTLEALEMSIVTKGGPMQVDHAKGSMAISNQKGAKNEGVPLLIDVDLSIAAHRPRNFKGKDKLRFFSGTLKAKGNFASIGPVSFLPDKGLNLTTAGEGDLEAHLEVESGELKPGSYLSFESEGLNTTFLDFEAVGNGRLKASVNAQRTRPVDIQIDLERFQIAESGSHVPYLLGSGLKVAAQAHRLLLYSQKTDGTGAFSFDIQEGHVDDIQHYNKFLAPSTGLRFLSGSAATRGQFSIDNGIAEGLIEISGTGVTLSAQDRKIEADFRFTTNLSEGNWYTRVFRLKDSSIRLDNVQVASGAQETDKGWWGEIELEDGRLVWQKPFDVSAKMSLAMRDVEPLLFMFRDPAKKNSKLDEFLNVKEVEGRLLAKGREGEFHIDPLHIDSNDLEVISRFSLSHDTVDGILYAKFKKVSANFEIVDKKPRMIGLGGRSKILKEIDLSRLDR